MSAHLRQAWRKLGADSRVQQAIDRALDVVEVNLDAQSYAADKVKRWQDRSWSTVVDTAMGMWRSSFINSTNIRAYLEGRSMAPAYQNDWGMVFHAEVIREEMQTPLGSETWRIQMGQEPLGSTFDWPIRAVAARRSGALEFENTLLTHEHGVSLYRVPAGAHGVWFPDRREGIVTGRFRVVGVEEVERGIMEVTLS